MLLTIFILHMIILLCQVIINMDVNSGSVTPTNDTIPNFIKLDQIPVNYIQQVETDLLEPVVFNQGAGTTDGFTRFTLQNKGFLHSHSKLFLSLQPASGVTDGYLPPHVGIGQVIKKAVFKVGNKVLNELDEWAGLFAIKSSLITNEVQLEREQYTTGRVFNKAFAYNDGSNVNASCVVLDNGMEPDAANDIESPNWAKFTHVSENDCPTYQLDLSDLFPFLKVNQLPLYMMDEAINIELTFQPTKHFRLQVAAGQSANIEMNIIRNDLKFCADYIFYGATDQMERYKQANQDMSFTFVDYRIVEHTTNATALASGIIQNLGMANRQVPRILVTFPVDPNTYKEESILGQYVSRCPEINASGNKTQDTEYNIRYNDRYEFTSDIDNNARLMSTFTESEGVPYISRTDFSDEGVFGKYSDVYKYNGRLLGNSPSDGAGGSVQGHFFNLGTKLTNGRVGQRGIELHIKGGWSSVVPVNKLRVYCEYMRIARLTNGMMEIFNA